MEEENHRKRLIFLVFLGDFRKALQDKVLHFHPGEGSDCRGFQIWFVTSALWEK